MDDYKARKYVLSLSLIFLILLAVGFTFWINAHKTHRYKITTLQQGTAFPKGIALKAFKLIDKNNQAFTNKNLKGHWSLIFFGFTHCPMVCPTTLSELNKTVQLLKKTHTKNLPTIIFISVDPERDNPSTLKKYLISFNKHFSGATGDRTAIDRLTKNLGIMYAKAKKSGEKNYQVNHSETILVINPAGKWVGILTPPFNAKIMADDYLKIIALNKNRATTHPPDTQLDHAMTGWSNTK